MIRINLLPHKRTGNAAAASGGGEGPSALIVIVVLVLAGLAGNGWYYTRLQKEATDLATKIAAEDARAKTLAVAKTKYEEKEREKELFQRRKDVIDQLKANQAGPVNLLAMIGDTINSTDQVWLSTMKDEGNTISIDGTALSANAVANLITNLKKTNYFKSVEIKETYQDDGSKNYQAFNFSLVCEKQPEKKS
jgi:type IV pilus assembly protein PilN